MIREISTGFQEEVGFQEKLAKVSSGAPVLYGGKRETGGQDIWVLVLIVPATGWVRLQTCHCPSAAFNSNNC